MQEILVFNNRVYTQQSARAWFRAQDYFNNNVVIVVGETPIRRKHVIFYGTRMRIILKRRIQPNI